MAVYVFHIAHQSPRNLTAPDLVFVDSDNYDSAIVKLTDHLSTMYERQSMPKYFLVQPSQILQL